MGRCLSCLRDAQLRPGAEEYTDSEKYQVHRWDINRPDSLADLLGRLNQIRRENPALQHDRTLRFHECDNPKIVCYSKSHEENVIFMAVNTDPYQVQWANIKLDLKALGLTNDQPFQAHDLLTGERYRWQGEHALVKLDPGMNPAHVIAIRKRSRTENDFDYFT